MTKLIPLDAVALENRSWTDIERAHVDTVLKSYDALIGGADSTMVKDIYSPDYRDHASTVPGGDLDGLIGFVQGFAVQFPDTVIRMNRVFCDGDHVTVHTHGKRTLDMDWDEIMEIFRLKDGLIIEHWETIEPWALMRGEKEPGQ